MNIIRDEIRDEEVLDSEIILIIECAKRKDPSFDINWVDGSDWTLLIHAVFLDREELAEYILEDPNIDVNYKDVNGFTAFYNACFDGNIPILKLLLSHQNLDVNIQSKHGRTGLHRACFNNNIEIGRELLLDARIDASIRDNQGKTARDIAIMRGYPGIANMIKRIGRTSLLRIPNKALCRDIARMIIEEYV